MLDFSFDDEQKIDRNTLYKFDSNMLKQMHGDIYSFIIIVQIITEHFIQLQ